MVVAVGQIATQNVTLAVGATSETVEVSATAQLLQTDTAQLSTELGLEQLENIVKDHERRIKALEAAKKD